MKREQWNRNIFLTPREIMVGHCNLAILSNVVWAIIAFIMRCYPEDWEAVGQIQAQAIQSSQAFV